MRMGEGFLHASMPSRTTFLLSGALACAMPMRFSTLQASIGRHEVTRRVHAPLMACAWCDLRRKNASLRLRSASPLSIRMNGDELFGQAQPRSDLEEEILGTALSENELFGQAQPRSDLEEEMIGTAQNATHDQFPHLAKSARQIAKALMRNRLRENRLQAKAMITKWRKEKTPVQVVSISHSQLRSIQKSEHKTQYSLLVKELQSFGLSSRAAKLILRKKPSAQNLPLPSLPLATVQSRLAALRRALPQEAARRCLAVYPNILFHDLEQTLPSKIEAIERVFGAPAPRLLKRSPQILSLDTALLDARRQALQKILPDIDVGSILRRAPALLSYSSSTLRSNYECLTANIPEVPASQLVRAQPTLWCSNMTSNVLPKLARLRQLTSEEEFMRLCRPSGSAIARTLTASMTVIERLSRVRTAGPGLIPRPVYRIICMTQADFNRTYLCLCAASEES